MKIIISSILMSIAFGIQIMVRSEGDHMTEIALLVEYVYHHIITVILATIGILIVCMDEN